ncbi:hypothetical protein D3C72_512420 [compost metagenome]
MGTDLSKVKAPFIKLKALIPSDFSKDTSPLFVKIPPIDPLLEILARTELLEILLASKSTNNFLVLFTAGILLDSLFCNCKGRSNKELYILMFQTAA